MVRLFEKGMFISPGALVCELSFSRVYVRMPGIAHTLAPLPTYPG
jgi:hypothetical protein